MADSEGFCIALLRRGDHMEIVCIAGKSSYDEVMEDLVRVLNLDAAALTFQNGKASTAAVHCKYPLPPSWKRVNRSLNRRRRSQSSTKLSNSVDKTSSKDSSGSDIASESLTNAGSKSRGRSCGAPSPSPGPPVVVKQEEGKDEGISALVEFQLPTSTPETSSKRPLQSQPLPPPPKRGQIPYVDIPVRSKRQLVCAGTESSDEEDTITLTGSFPPVALDKRKQRHPIICNQSTQPVASSSSSQIEPHTKRRRTSPATSHLRISSSLSTDPEVISSPSKSSGTGDPHIDTSQLLLPDPAKSFPWTVKMAQWPGQAPRIFKMGSEGGVTAARSLSSVFEELSQATGLGLMHLLLRFPATLAGSEEKVMYAIEPKARTTTVEDWGIRNGSVVILEYRK